MVCTRVSVVLDDRSGRIEVTCSEEVWQRHRELLVKDALLVVEGGLRFDEFTDAWRIHARTVQPLAQVRERLARRVLIELPAGADSQRRLAALGEALLKARGGECGVTVRYASAEAQGNLTLGEEWKVRVTPELIEQLERLVGRVRVAYGPPGGSTAAAQA